MFAPLDLLAQGAVKAGRFLAEAHEVE